MPSPRLLQSWWLRSAAGPSPGRFLPLPALRHYTAPAPKVSGWDGGSTNSTVVPYIILKCWGEMSMYEYAYRLFQAQECRNKTAQQQTPNTGNTFLLLSVNFTVCVTLNASATSSSTDSHEVARLCRIHAQLDGDACALASCRREAGAWSKPRIFDLQEATTSRAFLMALWNLLHVKSMVSLTPNK